MAVLITLDARNQQQPSSDAELDDDARLSSTHAAERGKGKRTRPSRRSAGDSGVVMSGAPAKSLMRSRTQRSSASAVGFSSEGREGADVGDADDVPPSVLSGKGSGRARRHRREHQPSQSMEPQIGGDVQATLSPIRTSGTGGVAGDAQYSHPLKGVALS